MNTPAKSLPLILRALLCGGALVFTTLSTLQAGSATWTGAAPFSEDWFNSGNWNPATVPDEPGDVATFATADHLQIDIFTENDFGSHNIDGMVFAAGAGAYSFDVSGVRAFTMSGAGIVNNSGMMQTFTVPEVGQHETGYGYFLVFAGNATAGDLTQFYMLQDGSDDAFGGTLEFDDASSAGSALISNMGSDFYFNGLTLFSGTSTAADATITNTPGQFNAGGDCAFLDSSSAGNATIINMGAVIAATGAGGEVSFSDSSSAGTSTITCNAGPEGGSDSPAEVSFFGDSTGNSARIILIGDGQLSVGSHNRPGVTIGSLEGSGNVILTNLDINPLITLQIGSNNLSTTFSGVIQDRSFQAGGSLAKVGRGTLILTGANTYAGTTTVKHGELQINNTSGSGTGTGFVHVQNGTLSGTGTIAGPVAVGSANVGAAFLSPGSGSVGTLTLQNTVTFNRTGGYSCIIDTRAAQASKMVASGVVIETGARIALSGSGHHRLPIGQVFTVISNTAATPISGTFANLPDDSTFTAGPNTYQANYEGGDGNDLTLTVVQ